MRYCLGLTQVILATTCLCLALIVSPFARCQTASATDQQGRSAQSASQTPASSNAPGEVIVIGQGATYLNFIDRVGQENSRIQQAIEAGEKPIVRSDYSKILGIREEEEQAIHDILVDAYQRIQENYKRWKAALDEYHRKIGLGKPFPSPDTPEMKEIDALGNPNPIIEETIYKLKTELGEEDFKRLDAYVFSQGRGGTVLTIPPSPTSAPGSRKTGDNSAPAVQP